MPVDNTRQPIETNMTPPAGDSPFDFDHVPGMEAAGGEAEGREGTSEYVLDLGNNSQVSEENVAKLTQLAKECGLDAAAASKFMQGLLEADRESISAHSAEALETLKGEWGAKFAGNMKACGNTLKTICDTAKLSGEEREFMKSPLGYRIAHAVNAMVGEGRMGIGSAKPAMDAKAQLEDIQNNPANPLHKALLDPTRKEYAEAARVANDLSKQVYGIALY